jgi:chemosensory pili system protein ChpA (sensor histidine kinase/response regulator)
VEDDPDIRTLYACVLEAHGFAVATAVNGEAALAALQELPLPCAALVDLRMPRMDGAQLIRRLHDDPERAVMPIAILTAEPERAQGLGYRVFGKPVRMPELLAFVNECASRPEALASA